MKKSANTEKENVDKDRRDFLKNSVYAAYATPLITILLVDAQSAAASPGNNAVDCDKAPPGHPLCP